MNRRIRYAAFATASALALVLSGCTSQVGSDNPPSSSNLSLVRNGKLVTCTHLSYKPFQFSQGDQTVGFDVELVDLVAQDLGVRQEIFDTPFETITSGEVFNTNRCDLAAAGMTITDARKQTIDFSDPYFDASQALLVRKGSGISDLANLNGKRLGVQQDTTGEEYANSRAQEFGYQIVEFEDLPLLETAVRTGSVDAAINDNGVLFDYVKEFPDTEVTTEFDTGEKYGIAAKKGNTALLAKVNEVVNRARENGQYNAIYEKWFGKQPE